MAWAVTADPARFDEAVDFFRERFPVTEELSEALGEYAGDRAWTIAGVAQLDIVLEVHESLLKAIADGTDFEEWQDQIESKLVEAWGKANSARIETIYLNATQQSYNAGRWRQMTDPEVMGVRPYGLFDAVDDDHTSDVCRECGGTILLLTDPWFDSHSPQLHHRCRSQIRSLSKAEARRRGVTTAAPSVAPEGDFGKNPLGEAWKPDASKYPPEMFSEFERKRKELTKVKRKRVKPSKAT